MFLGVLDGFRRSRRLIRLLFPVLDRCLRLGMRCVLPAPAWRRRGDDSGGASGSLTLDFSIGRLRNPIKTVPLAELFGANRLENGLGHGL